VCRSASFAAASRSRISASISYSCVRLTLMVAVLPAGRSERALTPTDRESLRRSRNARLPGLKPQQIDAEHEVSEAHDAGFGALRATREPVRAHGPKV
jgi:hypothetical protein